MNSIKRARKRPRVHSVNFRVLWWVLLREAALRVIYPSSVGAASEGQARRLCSSKDSRAVRGIAESMLRFKPERQQFP